MMVAWAEWWLVPIKCFLIRWSRKNYSEKKLLRKMLSNGRQRETRERQNVNGFTFQLINFSQ